MKHAHDNRRNSQHNRLLSERNDQNKILTPLVTPHSQRSAGILEIGNVLNLQQTVGNRAVSRLIARATKQELARPSSTNSRTSRSAHQNGCGCATCTTGSSVHRLIQRVPAVAFTALAPRAAGTAIPTDANGKWIKPSWLRGAANAAFTMRTELAGYKAPDFVYNNQNFYKCPLCHKLGDLNGMGVDHVIDWAEFCAGAADLQQLEAKFHELDNIHLVHANCNSSKQTADLFTWWQGANMTNYMDPAVLIRVRAAIERIYQTTGIDWLYEVPEGNRKMLLNALIKQAEAAIQQDASAYLMANGKIATATGYW